MSFVIAAIRRSSSPDAPADTGAAPRNIASETDGATSVHEPEVCEQIADRQHRRSREPHVLEDHLRVVVATAGQVGDQRVVGEHVRVDRLQLAMGLDRGRLERLVPLAQLLAPDLLLPDLFRAGETLWDLVVGRRPHRVVREAVDVLRLHRLDRRPEVPHELTRAPAERFGMHFRPIARHGTREVHRVQVPRPRAGSLVVPRRRILSRHSHALLQSCGAARRRVRPTDSHRPAGRAARRTERAAVDEPVAATVADAVVPKETWVGSGGRSISHQGVATWIRHGNVSMATRRRRSSRTR